MEVIMRRVCGLVASGLLALGSASAAEPFSAENWPYQAKVDESIFAPGGSGVTIHASPTGKPEGDGSAGKPLDLKTALARAGETIRSMETKYVESKDAVSLPVWLRLARKGDRFTTYIATDNAGQPGAWRQISQPTEVRMGEDAWVGVMVNNADVWPQKGKATAAKLDHVSLNGKTVDAAAWSIRRVGGAGGVGEGKVEGDTITIRGNGLDRRSRGAGNFADAGMAALTRASGDFDLSVRVTSLEFPEGRNNANLLLVARQPDDERMRFVQGAFVNSPIEFVDKATMARMAAVQIAAERKGGAAASLKAFGVWRHDLPKAGRDVRVLLAPGIYRIKDGLELAHRDLVARNKTFIIEGQREGDRTGQVVISGSQTDGWQAADWQRQTDGSYTHAWTHAWGGNGLADRREAVYLTPKGGQRVRLKQVLPADWKNEPGTFMVDEGAKTIRMALPADLSAEQFAGGALVEVPTLRERLLQHGDNETFISVGNNFVLRNLVFEHGVGDHAVQLQWWPEPYYSSHNILIEDVTFRENAREGFRFNHLRDFTLRRVKSLDNGTGNFMIAAEGLFEDCELSRNGWRRGSETIWNAFRNTLFVNNRYHDNHGVTFRNDHVAENMVFEKCDFSRNKGGIVGMFETAMGPIGFYNCTFSENDPGTSPDQDAVISLATTSNVTFAGCTFTNNKRGCISHYPRERAHTARKPGDDELCNNLDIGAWDTGNTPDARTIPGGKKGANGNRNITVQNCTFFAEGPQDRFIVQNRWQRPEAYRRLLAGDYRAYNNRYFNPNCQEAFELGTNAQWGIHDYGTFEQWKKIGGDRYFESGSAWGATAPRNFKPAEPAYAKSGSNAAGTKLDNGIIRYEAEMLPFEANRPVELLTHADASGGKLHKLISEQVGEHGGQVTYMLEVPAAGEYYVNVSYLRHNAPFEYLGYAQLSIGGRKVGEAWDQCGLTTEIATIPFGPVNLPAGKHAFRFDAVWRNGYHSGDYDITIDAIELSTTLNAQAATDAGQTRPGLMWQQFEGNWSRLPDFGKLAPKATGVAAAPAPAVSPVQADMGLRFTGFINIPADGIWRFDTVVNDGANLYIDGKRVIDNDGVHDGEKNEPWRKWGFIALKAGLHPVRVDYFNRAQDDKGHTLEVRWQGPGVASGAIPASAWSSGADAK